MNWLKTMWKKFTSATSKFFAGMMLFFGAVAVNAQAPDYPRDLTLGWENPSLYEDGTAILAGELDSIRFECSKDSAPTVLVLDESVTAGAPGAAQSQLFPGAITQPGNYTCFAWALATNGAESESSNAANKRYTGRPLAPILLTFE